MGRNLYSTVTTTKSSLINLLPPKEAAPPSNDWKLYKNFYQTPMNVCNLDSQKLAGRQSQVSVADWQLVYCQNMSSPGPESQNIIRFFLNLLLFGSNLVVVIPLDQILGEYVQIETIFT